MLFLSRFFKSNDFLLVHSCLQSNTFSVAYFLCPQLLCFFPTDPFTTLKLRNPSHNVSELLIIIRSPDFEAYKTAKGSVGMSQDHSNKPDTFLRLRRRERKPHSFIRNCPCLEKEGEKEEGLAFGPLLIENVLNKSCFQMMAIINVCVR